MNKLLCAVLCLVGLSLADPNDTLTTPTDSLFVSGRLERPLVEKPSKKFVPIYTKDTVKAIVQVLRKSGSGQANQNIMVFTYIKTEKSDSAIVNGVPTRMTTILRNTGWAFGDVPCDTCPRR